MYNLHLPFTGFPLALLTVSLIGELYSILIQRSHSSRPVFVIYFPRVVLYVAAAASFVTYFSGYLGAADTNHSFIVGIEPIELHRTTGRLFLFVLVAAVLVSAADQAATKHRQVVLLTYRVLLVISYCFCLWTSRLGGALVFEHGAAVRAPLPLVREEPTKAAPLRGR
jgi:hypothetical protein